MRVGDKAIYFGDLNDVLYENEYCRGSNISASQLSWGRQTLELCGLIDLGFEGYHSLGHMEGKRARMFRAVLTGGQLQKASSTDFYPIKVLHLPRYGSDHTVIRIDLETVMGDIDRKQSHIFRFEEVWSKDPKCENIVGQLWNGQANRGHNNLKAMQGIEDFFKEYKIGTMTQEIKKIENLLKEDDRRSTNLEDINTYKALEGQ